MKIKTLLILLLTVLASSCMKQSADLIIIAPTYTMNDKQPWAEAVVIKNNKIEYVGDRAAIQNYQGPSTKVIEAPDGMVLPGFIDTHVHLLWGGVEMDDCRLYDLKTADQIFQAIRNYYQSHPENEWIHGSGWELPIFPGGNPRKEWLDEIIPDKPALLTSADGHSAWANSRALELAGINEQTPDPVNGRIERDRKSNAPSGVLREEAMSLVEDLLPPYTKKQIDDGLQFAVREANRFGITSILDAGSSSITTSNTESKNYDGIEAYKSATENHLISLRVFASLYCQPESWRDDLNIIKSRRYANDLGEMNTVKIFADGVIEGGTAALLEPYLGTNDRGILNWHPDTLKEVVAACDAAGLQVHVHAIGDWGIRSTLDAFEFARTTNGPSKNRHMMSHVQLIHPQDVPRFQALDITASFQALWAYYDKYITDLTIPVLGPVRSQWMYPINSVNKTGARISGGSDWTVSSLNPLDAIEVAVTRRGPGDKDGNALLPDEAVTLETMLHAYTLAGAYSIFKENEIGSLQTGKLADLILLDRNLFQTPPHEIHIAKVLRTVFNGEIVYTKTD